MTTHTAPRQQTVPWSGIVTFILMLAAFLWMWLSCGTDAGFAAIVAVIGGLAWSAVGDVMRKLGL